MSDLGIPSVLQEIRNVSTWYLDRFYYQIKCLAILLPDETDESERPSTKISLPEMRLRAIFSNFSTNKYRTNNKLSKLSFRFYTKICLG